MEGQVGARMMECEDCGKQFYCYNQTMLAYKLIVNSQKHFFCSWSCMRSYEGKYPRTKHAQTRIGFHHERRKQE